MLKGKKHNRFGRHFLFVMIVGVILLSTYQAGFAQAPTPSDNDVNAVAKEMYCPVCENTPLDVCPTQACAQWRELIREKLAAGWTQEQIKDYFVEYYGDRVLDQPPRQGLHWLVYVLPPIFILAGAVLVYMVLTSMRKTPVKAMNNDPAANVSEDPYLRQLEAELHKEENLKN